jgi:hypothetical protein
MWRNCTTCGRLIGRVFVDREGARVHFHCPKCHEKWLGRKVVHVIPTPAGKQERVGNECQAMTGGPCQHVTENVMAWMELGKKLQAQAKAATSPRK